jgi:ATP-binding cassette subfamily C protein
MTGVLNVLYLTGSFFMLEIYDRVLPSRSIPTLVGLAVLALILYGFQGILDLIRGRVLVRIGASLDQDLSSRVYDVLVRLSLKTRAADGLRPLRDLDQIRAFLSGTGPASFFDLPWMPLYLGICFLFHPWIGIAATIGALILVGLAFLTETRTRKQVKEASGFGAQRMALAEASRRNAEVLAAIWAWPDSSACSGARPMPSTWPPTSAPPMSPAVLARSLRCSACCSNQACSGSALT